MRKVFLGGTCNGTDWRERIIPHLECDFFNPVVKDWTPECIEEEERQKNDLCGLHLCVITSAMSGVYSIAEMVESACNDNNKITMIQIIPEGFNEHQLKSLEAVRNLIVRNGEYCIISDNLQDLIDDVNVYSRMKE